eukprot:330976-Rhodomonas_salina.1
MPWGGTDLKFGFGAGPGPGTAAGAAAANAVGGGGAGAPFYRFSSPAVRDSLAVLGTGVTGVHVGVILMYWGQKLLNEGRRAFADDL